jgi:hypothetical protein
MEEIRLSWLFAFELAISDDVEEDEEDKFVVGDRLFDMLHDSADEDSSSREAVGGGDPLILVFPYEYEPLRLVPTVFAFGATFFVF